MSGVTPEVVSRPTRHPFRPQGKKASKKKMSSSRNDSAIYMEELERQGELTLAWEVAKYEVDKARYEVKVAATERLFQANEREGKLIRQENEMLRE
ncbi:hypothetical protein ACFX2C_009090 [Malus domestica]